MRQFEKVVHVDYFSDDPDDAIKVTCHLEEQRSTGIEVWEPDMASFDYTDMTPTEARGVWELACKYANEDEYDGI